MQELHAVTLGGGRPARSMQVAHRSSAAMQIVHRCAPAAASDGQAMQDPHLP
jgi:hypothetical protein